MYESLKLMKVEAVNGINAGDIEKSNRDHGKKNIKVLTQNKIIYHNVIANAPSGA